MTTPCAPPAGEIAGQTFGIAARRAGSRAPHGTSSSRRRAHPRLRPSGRLSLFRLPAAKKRSEEHTSELQSLTNLVCRLLLEKKKKQTKLTQDHTKHDYTT